MAGSLIYNYDASGNLTFAEEFDYQGTIWEYTRDTRNQVIRAAGWGSEAITDYRYNFAGHRYYKHVSGGSWEYFGLDDGVRTGLFGQATPGPIWNILAPSGRVIGRNPYNGAPSYYVTDHLGSTRVVVSSNGSIQEAYDYYPFGLPMPGRSITGWSETPERFTGYYKDQESYLYYAQARMYDPAIGRFLSVDPIVYDSNPVSLFYLHNGKHLWYSPYAYTFNNPVKYTDPDGKSAVHAIRLGARAALGAERYAKVSATAKATAVTGLAIIVGQETAENIVEIMTTPIVDFIITDDVPRATDGTPLSELSAHTTQSDPGSGFEQNTRYPQNHNKGKPTGTGGDAPGRFVRNVVRGLIGATILERTTREARQAPTSKDQAEQRRVEQERRKAVEEAVRRDY